jgi:hypothetical protein
MRLVRVLSGLLVLSACLVAAPAGAAEVSLFNGLPHGVEVVRLLENGAEQRPWSGPMEPGTRWRLRLPAGSRMEFRHEGLAVAVLDVGPDDKQGHVIRLPGVKGPTPPPPPRGQVSEFPNWQGGTAVRPVGSSERATKARAASRRPAAAGGRDWN